MSSEKEKSQQEGIQNHEAINLYDVFEEIRQVAFSMGNTHKDEQARALMMYNWLSGIQNSAENDPEVVEYMKRRFIPEISKIQSQQVQDAPDYRGQEQAPQNLLPAMRKLQRETDAFMEPQRAFNEVVRRETQTWLDVAFIQAAIGENAMASIGNVSEVANAVFGNDSRVTKTLAHYEGLEYKYEGLKRMGAYGSAAVCVLFGTLLVASKFLADTNPYIVVPFTAILAGLAHTFHQEGKDFDRYPSMDSQRGFGQAYDKMEIIPETKKFVEVVLKIQEAVKKLQKVKNPEKQQKIITEIESLLNEAKKLGDILIVAVNDDVSVKKLKGETRPIENLETRLKNLSKLDTIDFLISFSEETPIHLIEKIKPTILVKGGDYKKEDVVGNSIAEQVVIVPLLTGFSTTIKIERGLK